jgi:hypothetical protein
MVDGDVLGVREARPPRLAARISDPHPGRTSRTCRVVDVLETEDDDDPERFKVVVVEPA